MHLDPLKSIENRGKIEFMELLFYIIKHKKAFRRKIRKSLIKITNKSSLLVFESIIIKHNDFSDVYLDDSLNK